MSSDSAERRGWGEGERLPSTDEKETKGRGHVVCRVPRERLPSTGEKEKDVASREPRCRKELERNCKRHSISGGGVGAEIKRGVTQVGGELALGGKVQLGTHPAGEVR